MELKDVINNRRSFRAFEEVDISDEVIRELAQSASLAPSCYNNQPWKYIFVKDKIKLQEFHRAYSKGNEWCRSASLIVVVISKKEDDCIIGNRIYYQFDTGMATAFMILRATDLGLTAHPIAGFNPEEVASIINLPEDYEIITLLIVGKKTEDLKNLSKPWQIDAEKNRPQRKVFEEFCFINQFKKS